jgi:tetratricopeptide (TPR) repeat protein
MKLRIKALIVGFVCLSFLVACSSPPVPSNQNSASNVNSNAQNAGPTPPVAVSHDTGAPKTSGSQSMGGGSPIDTSAFDADIKKAEERYNKNQKDNAAKMTLAQAYLERALALTDARQYRSALGDYRRTLKLDPNNTEAKNMSDTIIGILRQMNREIPEEGKEPPPLPYNKENKEPSSSPYNKK